MPYLTPDEIPEDDACRPLSIPASAEWLAIVSGALTELTKPWNWEAFGSVTVDEAVSRMQAMVGQYYEDPCLCVQPGGEPWVQLDELGRWRMPNEAGTALVEPYGDYAIPAQTARTEATPEERRCLASKNAVNVLAALYEQVSDAAESGIQAAEFIVDFGLLIGLLIAPPLGLLARAAVTIAVFAYREFFDFADFLTEDFWTAEFTEKLVCIFYDHSTDDAGVVSFDFDGIYTEVFETQDFDLVVQGFRLAGQVQFLMRTVGAEGINLAGETTAITDDDCSFCPETWCYNFDFDTGEQGWVIGATGAGSYNSGGENWHGTNLLDTTIAADIERSFSPSMITSVAINFSASDNGGERPTMWLYLGGVEQLRLDSDYPAHTVSDPAVQLYEFAAIEADELRVFMSTFDLGDTCSINQVVVTGDGTNPFGADNC